MSTARPMPPESHCPKMLPPYEAHGPHEVRGCSRCVGRSFSSHPAPCDTDVLVAQCAGLAAHPLTQIGRKA